MFVPTGSCSYLGPFLSANVILRTTPPLRHKNQKSGVLEHWVCPCLVINTLAWEGAPSTIALATQPKAALPSPIPRESHLQL